jgi:glycosyltransferase involved in cell wall biosynthesis
MADAIAGVTASGFAERGGRRVERRAWRARLAVTRFAKNEGAEMSEVSISVIVDSYNYGQFIEEAIDSVLAQDFAMERVEILVVDDGSTDDTAERVGRYGERVKYIYKKNGGQGSAFNVGFANARGEIVAMLDADDYWLPGKLRRIAEAFDENPEAGMVYHRLEEYDMRTGARRDSSFTAISGDIAANRELLLRYILYPTSSLAFRRRCAEKLLPIPENLTIQADSHLSGLIIFVAPIVAIEESLAVYRVHGGNLFHAPGAEQDDVRTRRRIETFGRLTHGMKAWLKANGYDLRQPDLQALFMQWFLTPEADEFRLRSPGRLRFFRHLWRYNRYFGPRLTWRHLAVNYANAFGSLALGYKHLHFLEEGIVFARHRVRQLF